jgi:hypothetical protein
MLKHIRSFIVSEFIMTLGARNFQDFIFSYYIESTLIIVGRIYIDPLVEKLEHWAQRAAIYLSRKYRIFDSIFKNIIKRQLM